MTILEHPEAQALLDDARLSVAQLEEMAAQLGPFLGRYLPLLRRSEQRDNARHIAFSQQLGSKLETNPFFYGIENDRVAEPLAVHVR